MLDLIVIIIILSILQSILGVGVLLFGTPILLILDYSFLEVLVILLPVSLSISIATVIKNPVYLMFEWSYILMPAMVFSGVYFATRGFEIAVAIFVSGVLIFSGIKNSIKLIKINQCEQKRHMNLWQKNITMNLLAFIHGLSNQGGAILLWASDRFYAKKYCRRSFIAFIYGYMALIQLISVYIINKDIFSEIINLELIAVGLSSFLIGEYLFAKFSKKVYELVINIVMALLGFFLIYKII